MNIVKAFIEKLKRRIDKQLQEDKEELITSIMDKLTQLKDCKFDTIDVEELKEVADIIFPLYDEKCSSKE